MFLPGHDKRNWAAILTLLHLCFLFSCKEKEHRQVSPSFYYWKTTLNLSDTEKQELESLHVKTIYLKFFDVDWNEVYKTPEPVAKLQAANIPADPLGKLSGSIRVIPTVFITNECIQKLDSADAGTLAIQICELIKFTRNSNQWLYHSSFADTSEIQIDCDWTASTKNKYFGLLTVLKEHIHKDDGGRKYRLSCTIRLHQVKFVSKTGIPPVDRGLLMCYNMGNLKDPATKNSIIETEELKKYTGNLSGYPLPLDVAFPLFDWKVLYRNNVYTGLIQDLPYEALNSSCCSKNGNRYQVLKDTLLQGYDLRKGDMIRDEQSDIKEVLAAAKEIGKHLKNTPLRVSLYHLDSVILSKYSTHELENIYNSLR
ncbi:MAG: hypothetical protein ACKOU7_11840 [Ferruginibacter sp.]